MASMQREVQRMNERKEKERALMLYKKRETYMKFQKKKEERTTLAEERQQIQIRVNEVFFVLYIQRKYNKIITLAGIITARSCSRPSPSHSKKSADGSESPVAGIEPSCA